jgi:hypothetical protein
VIERGGATVLDFMSSVLGFWFVPPSAIGINMGLWVVWVVWQQ